MSNLRFYRNLYGGNLLFTLATGSSIGGGSGSIEKIGLLRDELTLVSYGFGDLMKGNEDISKNKFKLEETLTLRGV